MTAAFVVTLELSDGSVPNLQEEIDVITDGLESVGYTVVSVNPWDRPSETVPQQLNLPFNE